MDKTRVTELHQLTLSAYQAEEEGQWEAALKKHKESIQNWQAFERSGTYFSTEEREYKRVAKKRIELHEEREQLISSLLFQARTAPIVVPTCPSLRTLAAGINASAAGLLPTINLTIVSFLQNACPFTK
jgi:hypothetical protein